MLADRIGKANLAVEGTGLVLRVVVRMIELEILLVSRWLVEEESRNGIEE